MHVLKNVLLHLINNPTSRHTELYESKKKQRSEESKKILSRMVLRESVGLRQTQSFLMMALLNNFLET